MLVSVNWLKKYVNINVDSDTLAKEIGSKLVEVESIQNLADKYSRIVVAKVVSVAKVDGSDHLSLVVIDDGKVNREVKRDENGLVQVVCGAPNVKEDSFIVWIMPGAIVPETYGKSTEFVIESRKIMGVVSNGMIASARELDLFDEHQGILILEGVYQPGQEFAPIFELNDYILDIENKSLTQRPDCFGVVGFAREVAGISKQKFTSPVWFKDDIKFTKSDELSVQISDSELASIYQVAVLADSNKLTGPTLEELTYMSRVGVRTIDPIVDATNLVMLETGIPLHAFDYDKLLEISKAEKQAQLTISVRSAHKDESIILLDGRKLNLHPSDIVIAVGNRAVALAGAMGGQETMVDKNTRRIALEAASFNLYKLRSTQMRHGIFSEAITRFTKGQPAGTAQVALARAIDLLLGKEGSYASVPVAIAKCNKASEPINLSVDFVNKILGSDFDQKSIVDTLENVGFRIDYEKDNLRVNVPFWRSDVTTQIELVEEVGRINGYDNLKLVLPTKTIRPVEMISFDKFKFHLADLLSAGGANEALGYTFVSEDLIFKAKQDASNSYKIINSISPNLERYRQSILPSLINIVHSNVKSGFDEFAIYEINKVHQKSDGLDVESVPIERQSLGLVYANNRSDVTAYYYAKKYLDYLGEKLDLKFKYKDIEKRLPENTVFELKRSASVYIENNLIGYVGEFEGRVRNDFKLPRAVAGFELNLVALYDIYQSSRMNIIENENKYPSVWRDVCFEVDENLDYGELVSLLDTSNRVQKISYHALDIFRPKNSDRKRFTLRFEIVDLDKTLSNSEANQIIEEIIGPVVSKLGAEVI